MTRLVVWIGALLMPSIALGQGRVATPSFSVEGGEYSTIVMVTIRVGTAGATIRYTQNGVDPTESDPLIVSGSTIAINTSLTLKARAFATGRRPSDVRTATYTIVRADNGTPLASGAAAAGGARTLLATPEGRVFEWLRQEPPQAVDRVTNAVAVSAGSRHALALTKDGLVFGWATNNSAQRSDDHRGSRPKAPARVRGLSSVTRIAAGRDHNLALTADGRVWAWGSNDHGQLGISSRGSAGEPVVIPALSDVVAIGAGDAHSVAVTTGGEVFTWGSNAYGQLGDGTRSYRHRPTRIAIAPIADIAAGATHTLAMTDSGDVYSWGSGSRGELGTGSFDAVRRPAQIPNLRVAAIRAGRRFSAAVARDGVLMMWGANDAGQLGDETTVDRATPMPGPALNSISALALGARHAIAVTSGGDVWTWGRNSVLSEAMSDVANWGPALVEEVIAAPVIEPASGSYPAPQTVRLSTASAGAALRYTIDGSEPTFESTLYTEPFVVGTNAEVRARAFSARTDTEPSAVSAAVYVIDMVPPTIVATLSSAEDVDWYTSPVTVTFRCADDSGHVSCSSPVTVSSDGAGQIVSGIATDPAGNRSTASIIVNVDQTAPTVSLDQFAGGGTTTEDHLVLRGRVYDNASGLAEILRCNGTAIAAVQEVFECVVALRPGRNSISLQAADVAGHATAAGVVITRTGDSSAMAIAPDSRTLAMSEVAALSLRDNFGVAVDGAQWSSSDDTVASLSADDPPLVTALGAGTATITAVKNGMSAQSTITVAPAAMLTPGTTRWTLKGTPGWRLGAPIVTHRVEPSVPHMFLVESQPSGEATMHALTADGEVLWRQHSPGPPLMGDSFGGVIAGVYQDGTADYKAYVRLGSAGGVAPWRYDSPGSLQRPAQSPDGTVYAIESVSALTAAGQETWDKHVVVVDGKTGRLLRRWPLPRELNIFTAELDGVVIREQPRLVCASRRREIAPNTIGPIVGSDGRGYLLVRRLVKHKFDQCVEQHARHRRNIDQGIDLLILSPNADPVVQPVFNEHCEVPEFELSSCDVAPEIQQLLPDGIGGILASWDRFERFLTISTALVQRVMTRRNAAGDLSDRPVNNTTWIHTVGQEGVSYVFASGKWSAVDVTTWTSKWTTQLGTAGPIAAHPDGGLSLFDYASSSYRELDAGGTVIAESVMPMPAQWPAQEFDSWLGLSAAGLTSVVGRIDDATRWADFVGNRQGQAAVRRPGIGLFVKSQYAVEPIRIHHTALWLAPADQKWIERWYQQNPHLSPLRDPFKNLFLTLGAGLPNGEDSTLNCAIPGVEPLMKGINRAGDVGKVTRARDQLPVAEWLEATVINNVLDAHRRYLDTAPYACFPDTFTGFYNSNSYVHSLLVYGQVPHLTGPPDSPTPGWNVLIPTTYFAPK